MAERPAKAQTALSDIIGKGAAYEIKNESPDVQASRLRREEAEDAHERRIAYFMMALVALAFLASAYALVTQDPKTNLPDKAIGIITAIVAASLGFLAGRQSK